MSVSTFQEMTCWSTAADLEYEDFIWHTFQTPQALHDDHIYFDRFMKVESVRKSQFVYA